MELRHLRYFLAVAEHRHFGRAAASLGIKQPPLSQQIKSLETELGVQLLTRSAQGSEVTAAGEVFAHHARAALASAEAGRTEAQRAARGESGRVIVGFLPSAFDYLLPRVLRPFAERRPAVEIAVVEYLRTADQVGALTRGEVDVAIGRPMIASFGPDDALRALPLVNDQVHVVVPRGHPVARRSHVEPIQLRSEQFILTPLELRPPRYWHMICAAAGFEPLVVNDVQGVHTLVGMVAAGMGLGLVPESAKTSARTDVVFIPLTPPVLAPPLTLLWRADDDRELTARFVAVVRDVLQVGNDEMSGREVDRRFLAALREQSQRVRA